MTGSTIPPRPHRHLPAIKEAACAQLLPDLVEWNDHHEFPLSVERLARSADDNGFEFAANIQRVGAVSPDAELVEILEGYWSLANDACDRATREWVRFYGVSVPFVEGQRVRARRHGDGEITKVEADLARIWFRPDAERERFATGGGYILVPEDCEPIVPADGGVA